MRREQKITILIFLFMCLGYLAGWGAMFDSPTFRWTYMTWTFFGVMTTTSVFLTLLSFIFGIICRLNFGKGLPHYRAWSILVTCALPLMLCTVVNGREPIEDDLQPVIAGDPEKVAFPSSNEPIFSVAFGPEVQVPVLPQMVAQNAGLRFAQPMRMISQRSPRSHVQHCVRTSSERTYRHPHRQSFRSSVDSSVSGSSERTDNKRWVIE